MGKGSFVGKLFDYSNENSLVCKCRRKRFRVLEDLISYYFKKNGKVKILDIGGRDSYWKLAGDSFLQKYNIFITIVNLEIDPEIKAIDTERITHTIGDGCNLKDVPDKFFDIAHSNSVIEHVGKWDKVNSFANECRRVAASYYIQTPNFWFFIEPHSMIPFLHWLPLPLAAWIYAKKRSNPFRIATGIKFNESYFLLTKTFLKNLFPECSIKKERFMLMTKSLMVIYKG